MSFQPYTFRRRKTNVPAAPVKRWMPMGSLMSRAVNRHSLGTNLTASAVCQAANQVSEGRWQAISYREKRLKLAVADYDTVAMIRIREAEIVARINTAVGADAVTRLSFTVRPLQTRADVVT